MNMQIFYFSVRNKLNTEPQQNVSFEVMIRHPWFSYSKTGVLGCPRSQQITKQPVFCVCVFFDLLVSLFYLFFCYTIIIFRNPLFYFGKTEVCAGIPSCVMKAKKWPTSILSVRRVISAFSCEIGVHFRGGTQRVFEGKPYMIFCVQKHPFSEPIVLLQ